MIAIESTLYIVPVVVLGLVVYNVLNYKTLFRVYTCAVMCSVVTLGALWFLLLQCNDDPSFSYCYDALYLGGEIKLAIDSVIVYAIYAYTYTIIIGTK